MALDIFVNIGSGSNPGTLIGPRAFGQWNGGDYVVFNMDSGHMLVSTIMQKRSYSELKSFAEELAQKTYARNDGNTANLMNWLYKLVSVQDVYAEMTSTEKFEFSLDVRALRSALHLGPLKYHEPVSNLEERKRWAAYELEKPNFEIAPVDDVLLPDGSCHAVISISPFEYYPINRSTMDLLRDGGYFVVAGNFKSNKFARNPAGETEGGSKQKAKPIDPTEEFNLEVVDLNEMDEAWFTALRQNQRSVHTHSTDEVEIDFKLFRYNP